MGNYQQIVDDIMNRINSSGLIDHVESVRFYYTGPIPKNIFFHAGKRINFLNGPNLKDFEFPTLNGLKDFCAHTPGQILYLHTKGVSAPDNECINDWREYMMYITIERFADCFKALETHDSCGVDVRNEPVPHYSGNFWWANSEHINSLPYPKELPTVLTERHKAEFWVGSSGSHKSLWDCGIKSNERHLHGYAKEKYRHEFIG
jgi:hypothetical protein